MKLKKISNLESIHDFKICDLKVVDCTTAATKLFVESQFFEHARGMWIIVL